MLISSGHDNSRLLTIFSNLCMHVCTHIKYVMILNVAHDFFYCQTNKELILLSNIIYSNLFSNIYIYLLIINKI